MKYGIKVPLEGQYIWVMADLENFNEPILELYDTEDEAKEASLIWGDKAIVCLWE